MVGQDFVVNVAPSCQVSTVLSSGYFPFYRPSIWNKHFIKTAVAEENLGNLKYDLFCTLTQYDIYETEGMKVLNTKGLKKYK